MSAHDVLHISLDELAKINDAALKDAYNKQLQILKRTTCRAKSATRPCGYY